MIIRTVLLLLPAAIVLSGCATNPVTGENELSLISEAQELRLGSENYAPMRQSQGGDYVADPGVKAYVNEVGQRLVAVSDRPLPYEFSVLNSSVPNAWALPGGKIAVNRGLLTELDSEAELAAVLGHEIVHAAAKHSVQGMQRGLLLQGAVLATTVATSDTGYANLAQLGSSFGAQLINQKYGRDAERESDHYGMLYMSRAGYDPQGAVELQETFVKLSEGRRQDWLGGLFASHPPSRERVMNNARDAAALPAGGEVARERYRKNIARLTKSKPAYTAYDKAQQALSAGKMDQAGVLIRQALAIEPREGHFHSLLGDIERHNKRYAAARGHYDKAISFNDDFFYYYLQRGQVQAELDAPAAARRDLERSVKLLPTADAYNSLGNIARTEGRKDEAKRYYARASSDKGKAGKAAFASLVELDLPANPEKYLKLQTGIDKSGNVLAVLANPTPRDVSGIVLLLQYPDRSGRLRKARHPLQGRLGAGKKINLRLNVRINPDQAGMVRAGIVAARIAD